MASKKKVITNPPILVQHKPLIIKQKPIIIISGTPGTGKTTLAKILAKKLHFQRLDLHKYYKSISTSYDKKKQCYDINYNLFLRLVQKTRNNLSQKQQGLIIDSHITHLLPKSEVDLCIILNCSNLKQLEQRLKKRHYPLSKIQENIESEIMQICLLEAQEQNHNILTFNTCKTKSYNNLIKKIKLIMQSKY